MTKNYFKQPLLYLLVVILFTACHKENFRDFGAEPSVSPQGINTAENRIPEPQSRIVYGTVLPADANALITFIGNTTVQLVADDTGEFSSDAVPPGFYTVFVQPLNFAYSVLVINDIEVLDNAKTNLGTIMLRSAKGDEFIK